MARIKRQNTKPEIVLRKALWASGLRYRTHYKTPAGRPDIVFPGKRLAVFIDGCFWHGCPDHYVRPRTRAGFWAKKLRSNVERDRLQTLQLEECGWRVLRFWEHDVFTNLEAAVEAVGAASSSSQTPGRRGWRVVAVEPVSDGRERRILQTLRCPEVERVIVRTRTTKKW